MFPSRIEICGGIASGKTTLARFLGKRQYFSALENFQINPFWRLFYSDPKTYAFETELTFTLQHYSEIKRTGDQPLPLVCDFSLALDRAYAKVSLIGGKLAAYNSVAREVENEIGLPSLLIHLTCSARTELERIRHRGRAEERKISLDFLSRLNATVRDEVELIESHCQILTIDSEQMNFAEDPHAQSFVMNGISRALA